jgi:DNA-directed RNA polymerase alpha subunit
MAQVIIKLLSGKSVTVGIEDDEVVAAVFAGKWFLDVDREGILREMRDQIDVLLGESPGVANTASRSMQEVLERPIETLDILELGRNALRRRQIDTIGELVQWSEADLLELYNFGKKSLDSVKAALGLLGLQLNGVKRTEKSKTWTDER